MNTKKALHSVLSNELNDGIIDKFNDGWKLMEEAKNLWNWLKMAGNDWK